MLYLSRPRFPHLCNGDDAISLVELEQNEDERRA